MKSERAQAGAKTDVAIGIIGDVRCTREGCSYGRNGIGKIDENVVINRSIFSAPSEDDVAGGVIGVGGP